jgi:FKBP-type peptidyl-prolyl cis-trans isomerase
MNARLLLAGSLVLLLTVVGCSSDDPGVPVTDEMKQDALELARSGEMPDISNWQMDETDDGVRYVILSPGQGPNAWYDDEIRVHYYLWLPDGTLVDSTRPEGVVTPFEFTVGEGRTIAGWDELIQEMNDDAEAIAIVPWELGYGRQGRRNIPGRTDLVFYIEVLSIR